MNAETRACQNCKTSFVIEPDDFGFYEKMQVPAPTWCPECRMVRRFAMVNIWSLYKRPCSKCNKNMVTIYAPENPHDAYCMQCWWADDWDGTEYGMEYDPSRPFFAQLKELAEKTPYPGLESAYLTNINSDYCNCLGHCKNCYLSYWADFCENTLYSTFLNGLRDSLDCYRMNDNELCYECVGMNNSYRCTFDEECDSCTDVHFSRACYSCSNCIGCINMRGASYCIFNQKYSKEEYDAKVAEMHLDTTQGIETMKAKARDFWKLFPRRAYIGNSLNINVSGDIVYESKNTHNSYMVTGAEDCRYAQFISLPPARDCYDYGGWGNGAERIYESCVVGEGSSNVKFSSECWPDALDTEYSIYAISPKYNFGCVNLKRKSYAILNKVYSKDEYETLRARIMEDMERNPYVDEQGRTWKYGDFLPVGLAAFAYNESLAHQFFPKTKEEALAAGYRWHEEIANEYTITKSAKDLPPTIAEVADDIMQEVIGCDLCGKAYRIVETELGHYRRMHIPLPHQCPKCRHEARFIRSPKPQLFDRQCAKCAHDIKTSYAPDQAETVYCETCYQQEIL